MLDSLKVDIKTEGPGAWTRPYGVVDSSLGDDFRIHAAVSCDYEHILDAEGYADVAQPRSYAPEGISCIYVVKPEE